MPIVKRSGAPCQRPAHGRRSRLGTVTRSSTPGARTPETPPRRKHQRTTTLTTSRQTAHTQAQAQASKTQPHSTRAQHHTPRRPRRNCWVDHRPPNPSSSRSTRCAQDLRRQGAPQARDCSDSSSREAFNITQFNLQMFPSFLMRELNFMGHYLNDCLFVYL